MSGRILILLGMPGSGKGTQALALARECGYSHLSTGDIFRAAIVSETGVGNRARSFVGAGKLVPDDLVVDVVFGELDRRDGDDLILDGFPRTVPQATALLARLKSRDSSPDVVLIDLAEAELVRRLANRLVCEAASHPVQSVVENPRMLTCPVDGSTLRPREDDRPEIVERRLAAHAPALAEVSRYFDEVGLLRRVSGEGSATEVTRAILSAIEPAAPPDWVDPNRVWILGGLKSE